jgi:hypothetical protein
MRPCFAFFFACSLFGSASAFDGNAQPEQPAFQSFPVREQFQGPNAHPRLTTKQDREFRTSLNRAARQAPNFAGHYILTNIGCGASCVLTAVIDAKSGRVNWLPFTLCCWDDKITEPIEFRRDSDLMILHGSKDEKAPGTWTYRFTGERFQPISISR